MKKENIIFEHLCGVSIEKVEKTIKKVEEIYMLNNVYTLSAEGDVSITPVIREFKYLDDGRPYIKYSIPQDLKIITWGEYEELQDWDQDARKLFYELYEGGFEL